MRKALSAVILCLVVMLLTTGYVPEPTKAAVGYTDHTHNFTADDRCGTGCGGTGYSKKAAYAGLNGYQQCSKCSGTKTITCTTCSGSGKVYKSVGWVTDTGDEYEGYWLLQQVPCSNCNTKGSGYFDYYYYSEQAALNDAADGVISSPVTSLGGNFRASSGKMTCTQCGGSGYYGVCKRCNGYGVNYYCQNSQCAQGYNADYDNWKTESNYNSFCYSTEHKYNIVFVGNGADSGSTAAINGCLYSDPHYLTANGFGRTGYTFTEWNTAPNGTGKSYANGALVSMLTPTDGETVYLYAQWSENVYYLSYDANNGSDAPATQSFVFNSGASISSIIPSRPGYTFLNWKASHTDYYMNPGDSIPDGWGSFTLVAQWRVNSYAASFYPNGGILKSPGGNLNNGINTNVVPVTYDSSNYYAMNGDIPTRKGYTFKGWYDSPTGGTQVYDSNGIAINDGTYWVYTNATPQWKFPGDVALHAQWEHDVYQVEFHPNGGSTAATSEEYFYGDVVDLSPVAYKNGYIHVGWNTDPNATVGLSSFVMDESNVVLYAIYSIAVSDVGNHTYPAYEKTDESIDEVYLILWEKGNDKNYKKYPLQYEYDTSKMVYKYILDDVDTTSFISSVAAYNYAVVVIDNAGNSSTVYGGSQDVPPTPPEYITYVQTIEHYKKVYLNGEWKWEEIPFATDSKAVSEGTKIEPFTFVKNLEEDGYRVSSYDETYKTSYIVSGNNTVKIYYEPIEYTLSFDANGGTVTPSSKNILFGERYGDMPMPVKEGCMFTGWNTKKDGTGTRITSNTRYDIVGDSTVYAQWEKISYELTYDYLLNGGSSVSKLSQSYFYGDVIDLSPVAYKNGYTFVGWNTDPNATIGISFMTMPSKDVVLYAIYKKDITLTLVEMGDTGSVVRSISATIYNTISEYAFTITEEHGVSGWNKIGWTNKTDAQASPIVSTGAEYSISESSTLYALYTSNVTVTYDTNGADVYIAKQRGIRYCNASGAYAYPTFVVAVAPTFTQHSFVEWTDGNGNAYMPGITVSFEEDTVLTAAWDKYPELSANDRYFTLEQAQNGVITENALLEKVVGTDFEDGVLVNGTDVVVVDFNASEFTNLQSDAKVEITFSATDSFGNTVTSTIIVTVVDTTVKESNHISYYRFISKRFYKNGNEYVTADQGGLEETSIWKTNPAYQSLMDAVMSNKKINQETRKLSYYGNEKEYIVEGSGEWDHVEETWYFTQEDIAKTNDFREQYGFGSSKVTNYLEKFLEWFGHCKKQ